MKTITTIIATVALMAGAGTAIAASPWHVFGTANDAGEYSTYASVSSKVVVPRALAVRVTGPADDVSWMIICSGKTKALQHAGTSLIAVDKADTCDVSANVLGKSGQIRVQLLKR